GVSESEHTSVGPTPPTPPKKLATSKTIESVESVYTEKSASDKRLSDAHSTSSKHPLPTSFDDLASDVYKLIRESRRYSLLYFRVLPRVRIVWEALELEDKRLLRGAFERMVLEYARARVKTLAEKREKEGGVKGGVELYDKL
ncbi:MAG: hypothetical protein QXQ31_02925, partial [Zestosphaera sp.]